MTKKLVWPATFLVSFALASACGGGSGDADGLGGEGGEDGSTGGGSSGGSASGGQATGGGAGEGGLGGGGPVVIQPETCNDGEHNEDETDVDCGGPDCDPCEDDAACGDPSDCESGVCTDRVCVAPVCGDSITNGDEECDFGRETDECDADCTFPKCGDGHFNDQAEFCEPDPDLDVWQRCSKKCVHGADLDGTWLTRNVFETDSPWEMLQANPDVEGGYVAGMQSFHYAGMPYLYDLTGNQRYDIHADEWSLLPNPLPYETEYWENAAVDSQALWVPRESAMHRFDLETLEWTTPTVDVPDGTGVTGSAAVYDGDGFIWYLGYDPEAAEGAGEDVLVKYDPADGGIQTFSWEATFPAYNAHEPRVAYDPLAHRIVFISYGSARFLRFDLADETFTESQPLPDTGVASDNTCQDRAGGVYVTVQLTTEMYRYDIAADTFELLPELPAQDDVGSTCVVSEVGYLYYGTSDPITEEPVFTRLRLNHRD